MSLYTQSQQAIIAAERAQQAGDETRARQLFGDAAYLQAQFVESLPTDKARTRSVYGLSVATLYYRANAVDEAERWAHKTLSYADVDQHAADKLRQLIARIWDDKTIRDLKLNLSTYPISMFFRGGHVVNGTAPVEPVDTRTKAMRALTNRCGDFKNKRPLARSPEPRAAELYQAHDRHGTGSYRVDLYFSLPDQLVLPFQGVNAIASPLEVMELAIEVIGVASQGSGTDVEHLVTDPGYRLIFVRLARQLVPDGFEIGELELRLGGGGQRVVLQDKHRFGLNALIREFALPESPKQRRKHESEPFRLTSEDTRSYRGTLRAVDLDLKRIRVEHFGGASGPVLYLPEDLMFDDVVGPMLNKPVIVTEVRQKGKKWHVQNIEPYQNAMASA